MHVCKIVSKNNLKEEIPKECTAKAWENKLTNFPLKNKTKDTQQHQLNACSVFTNTAHHFVYTSTLP